MEKVRIVFEADVDLKQAFEGACRREDRTVSQMLRDLMRGYVREHAQPELIPERRKKKIK